MEKGKTRKRNKKEQDWLRYQLYQGNCYANDAGSHNPKMPVENFEVARDISPQSCYLDADFSNICFRRYIFAHGFAHRGDHGFGLDLLEPGLLECLYGLVRVECDRGHTI